MSMTCTINCGKANDCDAGRCRDISVSRRYWSVLIARRSMEYAEPMRLLVALWLTGLVAWVVWVANPPK